MSIRMPRRLGVSDVGEGSVNGKVVVEKAMRWWFVCACVEVLWIRGEMSVHCCWCCWEGRVGGWDLERRCSAREERRLLVRMRRRCWRVRTSDWVS